MNQTRDYIWFFFFIIIIFSSSFVRSENIITFHSRMYTFGDNLYYQLGSYLPSPVEVSTKQLIENFPGDKNYEFVDICTTDQNSYFLTPDGDVYGVGGMLYSGNGETSSYVYVPILINFGGEKIEKMDCVEYFVTFKSRTFDKVLGLGSNIDCEMKGCPTDTINTPENIRSGILTNGDIVVKKYKGGWANSIVWVEDTSISEHYLYATGKNGNRLLGNDLLGTGIQGWVRMNDSMIVNQTKHGVNVRIMEYFRDRALYLVLDNDEFYFVGSNPYSTCISTTLDFGFTKTLTVLPISEGNCEYEGYYNEIGNKTIDELQCGFYACIARSGQEIFSWGIDKDALGRDIIHMLWRDMHVPMKVNLPGDHNLTELNIHYKFVYLIFKDEYLKNKIYAFGHDDEGEFLMGQETIAYPTQAFLEIEFLDDLILSKGKETQSVFLLLSTTCFGYFADDEEIVCSGNGECYEMDKCDCHLHYYGQTCNLTVCFYVFSNVDFVCSGHGNCTSSDECECQIEYNFVDDCSTWECFGIDYEWEAVCGGNGDCLGPDECSCHFFQTGVDERNCSIPSCFGVRADEEEVCSKNGMCIGHNLCECVSGFKGSSCNDKSYLTLVGITIGSVTGAVTLVVCLFVILLYICCCFFLVFIFVLFRVFRSRMKRFEELENFDLLLEEQKIGKNTSIAHIKINKALFEIDFNDIKLIKILGEGGSLSTVYLVQYQGRNAAFKSFRTRNVCDTQHNFDDFEKEVNILANISHPNIVQYYGSCLSPPRIGIVMEFCETGDLSFYIALKKSRKEIFELSVKVRLLSEMTSAMLFLHSKKIIHRDLKLDNVLLTSYLTAKLMDFGLSKYYKSISRVQKTRGVGTSFYMSPEIILGVDYNEKTDVYSFAILLYVLLSERVHPYGKGRIDNEIRAANDPLFRPVFDKDDTIIPQFLKTLAKNCWKHDFKQRPSFKEIQRILRNEKGGRGDQNKLKDVHRVDVRSHSKKENVEKENENLRSKLEEYKKEIEILKEELRDKKVN